MKRAEVQIESVRHHDYGVLHGEHFLIVGEFILLKFSDFSATILSDC